MICSAKILSVLTRRDGVNSQFKIRVVVDESQTSPVPKKKALGNNLKGFLLTVRESSTLGAKRIERGRGTGWYGRRSGEHYAFMTQFSVR